MTNMLITPQQVTQIMIVAKNLIARVIDEGIPNRDQGQILIENGDKFQKELAHLLRKYLLLGSKNMDCQVARVLMGRNFFGPDEWNEFFGYKFQLKDIPKIPWDLSVLANPGIDQNHFLFFVPNKLHGRLINIARLTKMFPEGKHPMFYEFDKHKSWSGWENSNITDKFSKKTGDSRWYFMPIGKVGEAVHENLVPDGYEISDALSRVVANILYYMLNKRYFDTVWASTSDRGDTGSPIAVRGDRVKGICTIRSDINIYPVAGLSASLKLPA